MEPARSARPAFSAFVAALLCASAAGQAPAYFGIHVLDEQTGRGVPLVELTTTYNGRYITDSAGWVAFHEPGLMGQEVFFLVRSHGYEYPADGFGYRGVRLRPEAGKTAEIRIKRINIAERLYRLTGAGVYRDSVLLGRPAPTSRPVLNGLVTGQDSVINAIYRGRLYWFWGDTGWPAYPLGNFRAPGATSCVWDARRAAGASPDCLNPDLGVNLDYFVGENGFAKGTCAHFAGEGPVWLDGLVVLPDETGRERMLCAYARIKSLEETVERGIAQWDDEKQQFEQVREFPVYAPAAPGGHPLRVRDAAGEWLYFARGVPLVRCRATRAAYLDVDNYEAFTCLKPGTQPRRPGAQGFSAQDIDPDEHGRVHWSWRKNTAAPGMKELDDLVKLGELKPEVRLLQLRDVETDQPVIVAGGSVYWNDYRRRWVMIACEGFGSSMLGEIWYAEGDTPLGPWVYARKIITHDQYSFYNPRQHVEFDAEGGRVIYLEGTYTTTFSGNTNPTPYYDYNQVMYKLDLADDRLVLPVPIYDVSDAGDGSQLATAAEARRRMEDRMSPPAVFFACDRPRAGLRPVTADGVAADAEAGPARRRSALFYALPADGSSSPGTVPLYVYRHKDRPAIHSIDPAASRAGYSRVAEPVGRVWRNPHALHTRFDLRVDSTAFAASVTARAETPHQSASAPAPPGTP
jgi:hypothetical protein